MLQITRPKILKFQKNVDTVVTEINDQRSYAVLNTMIPVEEPTRLNNILLRIQFLNFDAQMREKSLRVFFFKNIVTYQSAILKFTGNLTSNEYNLFSKTNTEFWMDDPFFVESIGFSPLPNDFNSNFEIKVNAYQLDENWKKRVTTKNMYGVWQFIKESNNLTITITQDTISLVGVIDGKILSDKFGSSAHWFDDYLLFIDSDQKYYIKYADHHEMIFGECNPPVLSDFVWENSFKRVT